MTDPAINARIRDLIRKAIMNAIEAKDLDFITSWVTLYNHAEKQGRDPYVYGFGLYLNHLAEQKARNWLAEKKRYS